MVANTNANAQATGEPKAENEVDQAGVTGTETFRGAGKAVAETAIAIQDQNVHFTQLVVDQGLKQIEDQTVTVRKLYGTLASQSDARRAAFRDLGREAVEAYIGLLATPVKLARRTFETVRETAEQGEGSGA